MKEQQAHAIKEYLQNKDVQERIQKSMQIARSKATVTISQAAKLYDFTESQLRDWEKRGLLKTDRPLLSQDSKTSTGHRQFSSDELDKLALIRELMDQDYTISEIPQNIDAIWKQILTRHQNQVAPIASYEIKQVHEVEHLPIEGRIRRMNKEVFWRYFVSQVLRLSLMLLCEDLPDTKAGLIIPLQQKEALKKSYLAGDQPKVGPSLVGWLNKNSSFYSFLEADPFFQFPSDYRIQPFPVIGDSKLQDNVLIVIQREARTLSPNVFLVETIRRLLELLYQHVEQWQGCFDFGMRDWEYQVTDLTNPNATDEVLNSLADTVVELGGKTSEGQDRWHFCNLFLPQDTSLPLQQRNLVVRANSRNAPIEVNTMRLSVTHPGLTFKAYQCGHVIYRSRVMPPDIAYREIEESTRSAIALPIAGEDGLAVASLYIASDEADAFSIADQRTLRLITRMVEELLSTYKARRQVTGKLTDVITNPGLVDISFRDFLSENDFINDVEELLTSIHLQDKVDKFAEEVVSFIAIDIDNQSNLARKLGDHVARNLSRAVGSRILGQLGLLSDPELRRLYHVSADRYCLFLKGVKLNDARNRADNILNTLVGEYRIDARHAFVSRQTPKESQFELPIVTVRLGVFSYKYSKLKEVLGRYSVEPAVAEVRALLMKNLDLSLEIGQREGGNCIISWDYEIWNYRRWSSSEIS